MSTVQVSNVYFNQLGNTRIELGSNQVSVYENESLYLLVNNSTYSINNNTVQVEAGSILSRVGDYVISYDTQPPDATYISTNAFYKKTDYPALYSIIGDVFSPPDQFYTSTLPTTNATTMIGGVYANGLFVLQGYTPSPASSNIVYTSTDGTTWTNVSTTTTGQRQDIIYGNSLFVSCTSNNQILTSTDGTTWTIKTSPIANASLVLYSIAYGNGTYVIVGSSNTIYSSTDANTWTSRGTSNLNVVYYSIDYGNGVFVATGRDVVSNVNVLLIRTSTNGITWTNTMPTFANTYGPGNAITYGNGVFVISSNQYLTSTNGTTWTTNPDIYRTALSGNLTYGNGVFLAVGGTGTIEYSTDNGKNWVRRDNNFLFGNNFFTAVYGNGVFVCGGASGTKILRTFNNIENFYVSDPNISLQSNSYQVITYVKAKSA